jgi:Uncharacterised nucleotidyltransferase
MEPDQLVAARALATDAVCAEVVAAWRAAGVDSVLLKGPTVAEWLYAGETRGYEDADLLVAPKDVWLAAAVLGRLGFAPFPEHVSSHAHPWVRQTDGAIVDLHVRLWWGPQRPPERVFSELQGWLEVEQFGGVSVNVLNLPARALAVALHAAHDPEAWKPREDLRRALALTPLEVWRDAEGLADRLRALSAMAEGLRLEAEGRGLVERLPLVRAVMLGDTAGARLAVGFVRFSLASGARAKLAVLLAALARPDTSLEDRWAGRQPPGPIRHLLSLLIATPRTLVALGAARRRAGHGA